MFNINEEDDDEQCIYTAKYGTINPNSTHFDDHSLLGANYYQYKPEKIYFWTNKENKITGIQTWFKNSIDNNSINSGENKGSLSLDLHEFVINPNEYLTNCEIWDRGKYISGILLKTNKANDKANEKEKENVNDKTDKNGVSEFFVGEKKGNKMDIPLLQDGKKIIISFFGSYNEYLESFGLHLMHNKDYMKVLFTGYFELKAKLKKEKYKEEIMEKIKNKKYTQQEETIVKTCLLPSAPFNEVMKFCVI